MEQEHWQLEFVDMGIRVRGPEGLLATLPYPITEGGILTASYVKRCAYLMAAAPDLVQALKSLLAVISDRGAADPTRIKAAMQNAQAAIAKAEGK